MYRQSEKNLLSTNISSRCPRSMVNFGPLAAEISPVVWGTPANWAGFTSWQRYCMVLQQWASAKLCGVEQRTPPIFGRVAVMLGIIPHPSFGYKMHWSTRFCMKNLIKFPQVLLSDPRDERTPPFWPSPVPTRTCVWYAYVILLYVECTLCKLI